MIKYIMYLFFTLSGMTLIKLDNHKMNISLYKNSFNVSIGFQTIIGLIFYICSFLLWINILKSNKLIYIIPITFAILNIISAFIGIFLFKEDFSIKIIIGTFVSILGIILINS